MSAPPIACMLSGRAFKERLAWIADLNRRSLKTSDRSDLRLSLTYDARAITEVNGLAARERACCPFLTFEVRTDADMVVLDITAPEEAREAAEDIFNQLVGRTAPEAKTSCCGECS